MEERFIGIEIGGTKLQLVVGDSEGNIAERKRYTIDPAKAAQGIQDHIKECLESWEPLMETISAIGIGFGGPVNWKDGTIQVSHQIDGWENFNLRSWLENLTGKPVGIDNDANVAALGERFTVMERGEI